MWELLVVRLHVTFIVLGVFGFVFSQMHRSLGVFFEYVWVKVRFFCILVFASFVLAFFCLWLVVFFDVWDVVRFGLVLRRFLWVPGLFMAFGLWEYYFVACCYPFVSCRCVGGGCRIPVSIAVLPGVSGCHYLVCADSCCFLVSSCHRMSSKSFRAVGGQSVSLIGGPDADLFFGCFGCDLVNGVTGCLSG
ncbi:hypothetical protein [Ahrensia kielensis]|uniref:hypothetical protein n=1 Tax=Ahrensia kielensis TaxID=76980 RepID=UPI00036C58BD|nr:hypothetical protein [Ahrensia kielensis]